MPFDPDLPAFGSPDSSAEMRAQFNGLKDISDAIAATNITNVVVDSVTTLDPGQPATASVTVDGNMLHLAFGLPRGSTGETGSSGSNGSDGGPGPQGPPGEVTNAALSAAIAGTSANSNAVATMDGAFTNEPPTLADMEAVRAKMNELVNALRRPA